MPAAAKPTRLAFIGLGLTARAVQPLLAYDQKIELMPIFKDLNSKNFSAKKVMAAVADALKGKTIAKDANMEHVASMLDHLEHAGKEEPVKADESVSEPQHKAMEAAAQGTSNLGIPKSVGEEFSKADEGKSFDWGLDAMEFMRGKGMSDDDIEQLKGMLDKKPAADAGGGTEEKHEAETHEKDPVQADPIKDKKAMDELKKSMVTKDQLAADIKAAVEGERARGAELHKALQDVRPYVGELAMTFDSAEAVYRHTLECLGVTEAKTVHASALKTILDLRPKPGTERATFAADSAIPTRDEKVRAEINEIAPGLGRIKQVAG